MQMIPSHLRGSFSLEGVQAMYRSFARDSIETGSPPITEVEIENGSGEIITLQVATYPIRTENGIMFGSIHRDISDRIQSENLLRESEKNLKKAQEVAGSAAPSATRTPL